MNRLSIRAKNPSFSTDSSSKNTSTHANEAAAYVNRKGELVLYKDRFACLTNKSLKLYDYYMAGWSRTFPIEKIMAVVPTDDLGLRWEDRNSGGLAISAHIHWTNDWRRSTLGVRQNDDVLIVVQNEKWRKGFSLENRAQLYHYFSRLLIKRNLANQPTI
ncbi:hypothetical protein BDF19DRAFT_450416 [Syncephalis fuscata]|nr:hypothetical protein BDF19DRAFT_450416 [Syncephalis fuscata]